MPIPPAVDAASLRQSLAGHSFWADIRTVDQTGSTNRDVADLARAGAPEGLALVAEHQTAGRGRFDRVWEAPPGASLAISVLLRPRRPAQNWPWLPLVAGIAVVRGVRAVQTPQLEDPPRAQATAAVGVHNPSGAARVVLKWPNDVLVEGHPGPGKLCGILCERHETDAGPAAVLGFGLNIDLDPQELPVPTATSLAGAGLSSDKDAVLAAILRNLAELYEVWQARGHLAEAYARECATIGRRVRVMVNEDTSVRGEATGIDEVGRLIVQRDDGGVAKFVAGDVFHLRPDD